MMMFYIQAALITAGVLWTAAGLLLHHIKEEEIYESRDSGC
ncbi:hypothetical protein [uncultured Faecalibaculum sp.]|nr:hypothetical protein [uncultured Faecalibaculum sp.]